MTTDNAILEMLSSAGEDHDDGPTHTQSALECARRVRLDRQREETEAMVLAPHNEGRNVGTITHKLVQCHHEGVDPELYVPLRSSNADIEVLLNGPRTKGAAAWQVFNDYAEQFPRGFWGNLVGAELKMEAYLDDVRRTGIIDALWDMDEAAVNRVQDRFEKELNGPGLYLWDLKTGTSRTPDLLAKWEWRVQPAQYQWLAAQAGYPVKGMVVFEAIGYKVQKSGKQTPTSFDICVIPALDETAELRWRLQVEKALDNTANDDFNTSFCNAWFRECPHKASGECEGV